MDRKAALWKLRQNGKLLTSLMETNGKCSIWSTNPIKLLNIPTCWRLGAKGISCCHIKGTFGCNNSFCVTSAAFIYKTHWALSLLFLCLWHIGISIMLVTQTWSKRQSLPSTAYAFTCDLSFSASVGVVHTMWLSKAHGKTWNVLFPGTTLVIELPLLLPVVYLSTDNLIFLLCIQLRSPILEACSREK